MDPVTNEVQVNVGHGKINALNLIKNQYTISLLHEALRIGILNRREANSIQVQIMMILKDVIIGYTKGESSSVTYDTAERLLNSILYSIDAYTLYCSSPEEAVEHLKASPLKGIYLNGLEKVREWLEETKLLYDEVRENKLNVHLEPYNLTIQEGIPLFLKNYGIVFDSHITMASIDYPLVFDDMTIRGVVYIKNYLINLKTETEFCRNFSEQDIEMLLSSFGRKINMDYKIELINIFELVFNNAVFSIMSGNTDKDLIVSQYHFDLLNDKLKSSDNSMVSQVIEQAVEKLIHNLNIDEPYLLNYISLHKTNFIKRVINAVKNGSLDSIIITGKEENMGSKAMIFRNGERMSDDKFISSVKRLMNLKKVADKIIFIKSNFSSLYDFIDVLNSDCLFGDEYEMLFSTLGDMELAMLSKIVFYEELRGNSTNLSSIIKGKNEGETEWQIHYIQFIQKINKSRIELIEVFINEIQYEEISFY